MRNGFYKELDEIRKEDPELYNGVYDFSFMENCEGIDGEGFNDVDEEGIRFNAFDFLHGYCNEFADFLHKKYGYQVEAVKEDGELVHMYCTADISGKKHYIDIRGITDSWEEFMEEFYNAGLWGNDDRSKYIKYQEVPKKYRCASKKRKMLMENLDMDYDYYRIPATK